MGRGPAYPSIPLGDAVEIAARLHRFAGGAQPVAVHTALTDERLLDSTPTSSSGLKKIAALKYFGLTEEVTGGTAKQIRITERARRILFDDPGSPARRVALRNAALEPKHYRLCWQEWGAELPNAGAMRTHLLLERGFVESTVDGFIKDYKASITYAGLLDGGSLVEPEDGIESPNEGDPGTPFVSIGDYIQWKSQGILQFRTPRRVQSKSADGEYVFVDGIGSGIPVAEVSKAAPPPLPRHSAPGGAGSGPELPPTGVQQATMPLPEGDAALQWPKAMSRESFEDFEAWLQLMLRRARRSIVEGAPPRDDRSGQDGSTAGD